MIKFHRAIPERSGRPLADVECEEIKDRFKIDNDLDDNISLFNSVSFQSWTHDCLDSFINPADGERWNRYDGNANAQGIYPARRDSPMLLPNGYFRLSEVGLPYIAGTNPPVELAADSHRANEHPGLKAFHLFWVLFHNKRMDAHGDFDLAKQETIASKNVMELNELKIVTGFDFDRIFNGIKLKNFHMALEFVLAVARWAHGQMPDTLNGLPIFQKRGSGEVDLHAMLMVEKSRKLNLGVSNAMVNMDHLPTTPHSILERTFARHNEHRLPSGEDLAKALGIRNYNVEPKGCPMFPAMLIEAENHGTGTLGPMGAAAVSDGVAGSFLWGIDIGQGLWHPRWQNAPDTSQQMLDYVYG